MSIRTRFALLPALLFVAGAVGGCHRDAAETAVASAAAAEQQTQQQDPSTGAVDPDPVPRAP